MFAAASETGLGMDDFGEPSNADIKSKREGKKALKLEPSSVSFFFPSDLFAIVYGSWLNLSQKCKTPNQATQRKFQERRKPHIQDLKSKLRELKKRATTSTDDGDQRAEIARLSNELNQYKTGSDIRSLLSSGKKDLSPFHTSTLDFVSTRTDVPHDVGIAGHLFGAAFQLLSSATARTKSLAIVSKVERRELLRILQSLYIWGKDHDSSDGGLDLALQRSLQLQRVTLTT
jgi:hypothetical protein